jgi:hypothetical protein
MNVAHDEKNITDPEAAKYGLPPCLRVPIAAVDVEAIETYVGEIAESITGRDKSGTRRVNALLVRPHERSAVKDSGVKLWTCERAAEYEQQLFPDRQVWVHVDFNRYRRATLAFGISIRPIDILDHVQNREAIRMHRDIRDLARVAGITLNCRWRQYLRLCPIRGGTNSNAGGNRGAEGMEKENAAKVRDRLALAAMGSEPLSSTVQGFLQAMCSDMIYADPADLTKMLDIPPGTFILQGVGSTEELFYP